MNICLLGNNLTASQNLMLKQLLRATIIEKGISPITLIDFVKRAKLKIIASAVGFAKAEMWITSLNSAVCPSPLTYAVWTPAIAP